MRVLVTGAGGFVGAALTRALLKKGHRVRGLGRSPQPALEALGVEFVRAALADPERVSSAVKGVEAVFHTAARAGVWGPDGSFYSTNVDGTDNILKAVQRHGVPNLVYTSTPSVVYHGGPIRGGDESLPYGKRFPCAYARTKRIAEEAVLKANSADGSLRTTALRPHLIWGPGDPHLLPRVIERARSGRLKQVGSGQNQVDLTYIDNVVEAHLLALKALQNGKASGKAYFITNGQPVNLWNWIRELLETIGHPLRGPAVPLPIAYGMGATLETIYRLLFLRGEPPMTRFVAVELAKDHYFSIQAARRDLGYEPTVSMEDGLRHWYNTWT